MITRIYHLPTHTPFFRPIMSKKRALHLFLKITFFCSVLLLLTPEHFLTIFSGKLTTKNGQKTSKRRKKFFSFFYNLFHIPLNFSFLLLSEIEKPQGKTCHKKFFFFFFFFLLFCILPLFVIGKITTYIFFRNSDLKCPKMPLSELKFHFLQITFFPP